MGQDSVFELLQISGVYLGLGLRA